MDEKILKRTKATSNGAATASDAIGELIRPLQVRFPQSDLDELRRRIRATRFADRETITDGSQGVPLRVLRSLMEYWADQYDWRRAEVSLSQYPNFITEIDGLDIHFVHARSRHPEALPIIICHGWPYSVMTQLKIVRPLTDPTAHGGIASEAFHVVMPSMPGYGFSERPDTPGWDPVRIARAYITLMRRLGYTRFVAQGGDWGGLIVDLMAMEGAPELAAIHTNMAGATPPALDAAAASGAAAPDGLSDEEHSAYEQLRFVYQNITYARLMGTRPQTLAALADSPAGLASFLLDTILFVLRGSNAGGLTLLEDARVGQDGVTRDDVLDNLTLYWLTNTGVSASRIYWENRTPFFAAKGVTIPVAVSVFPDEIYTPSRSWAQRAYPNLIHYNRLDRGGHFPSWEQPTIFTAELRRAFGALRFSL